MAQAFLTTTIYFRLTLDNKLKWDIFSYSSPTVELSIPPVQEFEPFFQRSPSMLSQTYTHTVTNNAAMIVVHISPHTPGLSVLNCRAFTCIALTTTLTHFSTGSQYCSLSVGVGL